MQTLNSGHNNSLKLGPPHTLKRNSKASVGKEELPNEISSPIEVICYRGKGNWEEAQRLVQSDNSPNGSWVHAYLHRVEGDLGNAAYWYRMADEAVCNSGLDEEWVEIVAELT